MKTTIQSQLDSVSLTESAYKDLRPAILIDNITSGTLLIEASLAEQMGSAERPCELNHRNG